MFSALGYFLGLIVIVFTGVHVASAILFTAVASDQMSLGILSSMVGNISWNTMNQYLLVAIPLFVLLGEILTRSGIADRMYRALGLWLTWLPGGLLHANIATCALFAATSGSSVATAATIGTVAQPTMKELGYRDSLTLGSVAAGGTLGILIPPSINMIVYGSLTNVSVGKLFAAGIIPGILLVMTMSAIIIIMSLAGMVGDVRKSDTVSFASRIRALAAIIPVGFVFLLVMGSIYAGVATPTEAASIGIVGATLLAAMNGTLSIEMLHSAFLAALKTTAMILLILVAAFALNFVLSVAGIPQALANQVGELGLSPYATIWLLVLFYLILGCFLEAIAMMVTTVGVVVPLIIALGFDPLWFGIFLTLLMEMALITPPVGLNLYVVQNVRTGGGSIADVFRGIIPFALAILIFIAILIYVPELATWLPNKMF